MTKLEPTIEYLQKKSYTKPDYNVFRDKIEEVFKVDLDKYPGDEVLMGVKDGLVGGYDNDLYIVSKVGRFIYSPNLFVTESKPEEVFLHLNKYLFNEDKAAFNYLSASKNEQLFFLAFHYGYLSQELKDFLFPILDASAKNHSDGDFSSIFFGRTGAFGKWQLRKDIFNDYMEHNMSIYKVPEGIYSGAGTFMEGILISYYLKFIQYVDYYEASVDERDEHTALLLEWSIKIARMTYNRFKDEVYYDMDVGDVQNVYDYDISIYDRLGTRNFCGYNTLIEYSKNYIFPRTYEGGSGEVGERVYKGVVDDPDGYVNMRSGRGTKYRIIRSVKAGDKVGILCYYTDWWYVEIPNTNIRGFIHSSRLKSNVDEVRRGWMQHRIERPLPSLLNE